MGKTLEFERLGKRISRLRKAKGYGIELLAQSLITVPMMEQIEASKSFSSAGILSRLAIRLGTTFELLISGTDYEEHMKEMHGTFPIGATPTIKKYAIHLNGKAEFDIMASGEWHAIVKAQSDARYFEYLKEHKVEGAFITAKEVEIEHAL